MGNSHTREAFLQNEAGLKNICLFDNGLNVYRWRRICKKCCEIIDKHRCVSTLVFPSVLVHVKRPLAGTKQNMLDYHNLPASPAGGRTSVFLPHPCWGNRGQFVCCQESRVALANSAGRSMPCESELAPLTCELDKDTQFVPVARLGSDWWQCQVSVPGWLVQGACTGKLKGLVYDTTPCQKGKATYQIRHCKGFLLLTKRYDEIQLQREALQRLSWFKRSIGLIDCLALWMHPAVFPRLEELKIAGDDLGMKCPSQMYQGTRVKVANSPHWSCWIQYASCVLTPLLSLNGAACGLKKLQLTGPSGKLVAEIIFNLLKIEMPSLTHLEIDRTVVPTVKGDSPSLRQVTYVSAEWLCEELGKLPNLEMLQLPQATMMASSRLKEFVRDGLFAKLRRVTSPEWVIHGTPFYFSPQNVARDSCVPWDLPACRFQPRDLHVPLDPDWQFTAASFHCYYKFPKEEEDYGAIVLPPSTKKFIMELDDADRKGIPTPLYGDDLELDEFIFECPKGFTLDKAWRKFADFYDEAREKELFHITKAVLINIAG